MIHLPCLCKLHKGDQYWYYWPWATIDDLSLYDVRDPDFVRIKDTTGVTIRFHSIIISMENHFFVWCSDVGFFEPFTEIIDIPSIKTLEVFKRKLKVENEA